MKSSYIYYTKYILAFLFQSGYAYTRECQYPRLVNYKVFISLFEHQRLQNRFDQQFFLFLTLLSPTSAPWSLKTVSKLRNPHYLVTTHCKKTVFDLFERFLFVVYPFYRTSPIRAQRLSNNTLTVALPGYRFLELEYLRPGERYVQHALAINTTCRFQFFLTPESTLSLYEQRNFFRALNLPLQNFEK